MNRFSSLAGSSREAYETGGERHRPALSQIVGNAEHDRGVEPAARGYRHGVNGAEPPAYCGNQELAETIGVVTTSAVTNLYPRIEIPELSGAWCGQARRSVKIPGRTARMPSKNVSPPSS